VADGYRHFDGTGRHAKVPILASRLSSLRPASERPENRADFDPVTMSLQDDQWTYTQTPTPKKSLGLNERVMFALLQDAMPDGLMQEEWNKKAREQGITTRQRLYEVRRELKDRKQCTNADADGSSRAAAATSRVKEPLTHRV
jgi:hypothetical protein